VLGASLVTLWRLLSGEFVLPVIIALFIAIPTAYYFMHNWLQDFQYRTAVSWWIFAMAGIIALLVTLLTVSYHSIRSALMNPVKSLRTE
jgi:fumarate reductase subunit D